MTRKHLFLPVQWQMISKFADNYLCQQAGASDAFFDRLWWFGRSPDCAGASVFLANIFDDSQLCRNVFVAFTRLFTNRPQVRQERWGVLCDCGHIMQEAFALDLPWQRLPPAVPLLTFRLAGLRL